MPPTLHPSNDDAHVAKRIPLKCQVCGGFVDEEDLFCSNCGRSVPDADRSEESNLKSVDARHCFGCDGCGASMSYDASAGALRCPFCGSEKLKIKPPAKTLQPDWVVPFIVEKRQAEELLRLWLGKGFWRPARVVTESVVTKIAPVYAPYWDFSARTYTHWTADVAKEGFVGRGDWRPVTGNHQGTYRGLLVGASGVLTQQETAELCPFDVSASVPFEQVNLHGFMVEQFSVSRKYARPLARHGIEDQERNACAGTYLRKRFRNLRVSVRIADMSSHPVLLPVWVIAYRYQGRPYRSVINGQTGQICGEVPFSNMKLVLIVGLAILAVGSVLMAWFSR
ncbi:MAG: hypothetical protein O2931_08145 [Planctomycetota bacterium]|nr:hypothetical protein [Planctomycetota bacterium]MDA1178751.1 hypothetical protein [Planctomycetota bacterium]